MIARALGVALLAAIVALGVQTWRITSLKADAAERERGIAEQLAVAEKRAREAEQLMAEGARKAAESYAKQIARVRTDADSARGELERLRDALGTPGDAAQDAAAAARADDATRARTVVGQCAGTLQTLAAVADQCEARLSALQDWAKAVTK